MNGVVFAYREIGSTGLKALLESGVRVLALFTHDRDPWESFRYERPEEIATGAGIPVYTPEDPNGPETVALLKSFEPDYFFSFYYRKVLSAELLRIPKKDAFNLHGSLLPKYRGRAPINWAILRGETQTGVTIHRMTVTPDAGEIVLQERIPIGPEDTAMTVSQKVDRSAEGMVRDLVGRLRDGTLPFKPQNEAEATRFPRRRPEDGRIDWNQPASVVCDLVRALTSPWPGAFSFAQGRKLFFWWARPVAGKERGTPGRVVREGGEMFVETRHGTLYVLQCQWEGGEEMSGSAFLEQNPRIEGLELGR